MDGIVTRENIVLCKRIIYMHIVGLFEIVCAGQITKVSSCRPFCLLKGPGHVRSHAVMFVQ